MGIMQNDLYIFSIAFLFPLDWAAIVVDADAVDFSYGKPNIKNWKTKIFRNFIFMSVTGIFIVATEGYTCSNSVTMAFGSSLIQVENCFVVLKPLDLYQEVECLLKFESAPSMRFTAYVKHITAQGNLVLNLGSHFTEEGVEDLLADIRNFNLYLLREES